MHQTSPLSFEDVLAGEKRRLLRDDTGFLLGFGATNGEALASAGFVELEVAPFDHGHGKWTYAQHVMAHALKAQGLTYSEISLAIAKSPDAVRALICSKRPWCPVQSRNLVRCVRPEHVSLIVSLRGSGSTWQAIANITGFTVATVRAHYARATTTGEEHGARV